MGVTATMAAAYQVEAVCRTPLRTGGTEGDPERVLRDRDGAAFLQGSSLAGAFRGWLEAAGDRTMADSLLGTAEQAGRLILSDGRFDVGANQYTRPRLRIDSTSATGADGGKFDVAHMGRGARLQFSLIWMGGPAERDRELAAVERLLSALNAGAIRLGAQKSNGFGQLSLTVKRRLFDLTVEKDRRAWLADQWDGEPLKLNPFTLDSGVRFTVTGRADNLLVKAAPVTGERDEQQGAYTPNLSEGGQALLPGSSIKGAVRARAAYIAKVLGLGDEFTEQYFGRDAGTGDNGLPGLVQFEDAPLSSDHKKKVRRIRIDRFTGGVQRAGLFTEEPISTDLELHMTAPEEPALCGLLLYALRDLGLGLYNLGSGWAIGRGQVAVEEIRATAPGGRSAALRFDGQGGLTQDDPSGLLGGWLMALEEVRNEH